MNMERRRIEQLQNALDAMGNTHDLDDIRAMIDSGDMQSFAHGDTWAVTQILDLPRKRVLELFLIVGDLAGLAPIYPVLFEFAKAQGCDMVRGFGRDGWSKLAKERGWTNGYRIYMHEVM